MKLSRLLAVAVFAGTFTALGCGHNTAPDPTGTVTVHVLDANNAGVGLVNVDLNKVVNGALTPWRAGLTSAGVATFTGITAGSYSVHLSFNSNYQLAATETNDKAVTVVAGADASITFHVEQVGAAPR